MKNPSCKGRRRSLLLSLAPFPAGAFFMQRASRSDFVQAPSMFEDEPIVVEDVLRVSHCQEWWDHILTRSPREAVQVQRHGPRTSKLPLEEAVRLAEEQSSHWNPVYITSIGSSCSTDQLPLHDTLEELFVNPNTDFDDTMDWFDCLGRHAPVHDTLVVAGEGATSPTICSHPFTKHILCLEGSQLLRAMPPPFHNKDLWKELTSPIWATSWDGFPVSLGSQLLRPSSGGREDDPLNLFAYRHRDVDKDESYDRYQEYAEDANLFHPNWALPPLPDAERNHHGLWHSAVVLPGELAVIPPGWWYQTYNLQDAPNIGLHSQRCGGSAMGGRFVRHLLDSAFGKNNTRLQLLPDEDEDYFYTNTEAQELIDKTFVLLHEHYQRR